MERKGEREEFVCMVFQEFSMRCLMNCEKFREYVTCRGLHEIMVYAGEHAEAM